MIDCTHSEDMQKVRDNLSYYFLELSEGIKRDARNFEFVEYINFCMLDIISQIYFCLPELHRHRFKENIKKIGESLKNHD